MKILLGVTGGIAAYRAAELARSLTKRGHTVRCCITEAGTRFITPLTLSTLTGQPCFGANPDYHEWRVNPIVEHVDLARWADVVAVAPATADIMGKTANGLANDLLSTVLLASTGKILWAPAMNKAMWANPAVKANVGKLISFGHEIVEPTEGLLACGEEGAGKLADILDIHEAIELTGGTRLPAFDGKKILVTAGPTHEDLDPARTLTNRSTGTMGVEIARALAAAGANVELVIGGAARTPYGVTATRVRSAQQMFEACQALWPSCDGVIAAAAVADQRPEVQLKEKAKKTEGTERLTLVRTSDILANLSSLRKERQWLVGFAAESENHVLNASEKLAKKSLDAVLLNDISGGRSFGIQTSALTPVTKEGPHSPLGPLSKDRLAEAVVEWLNAFVSGKQL